MKAVRTAKIGGNGVGARDKALFAGEGDFQRRSGCVTADCGRGRAELIGANVEVNRIFRRASILGGCGFPLRRGGDFDGIAKYGSRCIISIATIHFHRESNRDCGSAVHCTAGWLIARYRSVAVNSSFVVNGSFVVKGCAIGYRQGGAVRHGQGGTSRDG